MLDGKGVLDQKWDDKQGRGGGSGPEMWAMGGGGYIIFVVQSKGEPAGGGLTHMRKCG